MKKKPAKFQKDSCKSIEELRTQKPTFKGSAEQGIQRTMEDRILCPLTFLFDKVGWGDK